MGFQNPFKKSTHSLPTPTPSGSSSTTIDVADQSFKQALVKEKGNSKDAADDPLSLLPEHEAEILRKQIESPERSYGVGSLYRYATRNDMIIVAISAIASIASGAALPCMTIIFGGLQGVFQEYTALHTMTESEFQKEMAGYVLYFVYLAIGTFIATYISTVGFIYTGEHIAAKIRQRYLESCLRQNIGYFDELGAGEVTTKITADATIIQDGMSEKVGLFIAAVSTFITGFVIGFVKSWKLTLILSSTLVALFINTSIATKFIVKYSTPMMVAFAQSGSVADEVISSIRVAVAFGTQDRLAKQYADHLETSQKWGVKLKICVAFMMAGFMSLLYLNYGLGFWQGSTFLAKGDLPLSDVTTTLMSVMIGAFNMGTIGPYFQAFTQAVSAASKMFNTIDRQTPLDATNDKGMKIHNLQGHIRLENIKHIYPSRPEVTVMDDVSFEVPAGKVTALVGASGSGKSTIVGLVERFYDPVRGRVCLDGRDVSMLNLRWLRQQIALVGQEPTLFAVSIYENIRYGLIGTEYEDASEETQSDLVMDAARQANAHDFISELPEAYETNVGQRGFLLSGGQKQRIAIARAIVSDPKILLLDEATSALDTKSEGVVQAALENASEGRTTIAIAHRLSTIRNAYNIIVMEKGRIIEQGTHDQLLTQQGAYYNLVSAQQIEDEVKQASKDLEEALDEEEEKLIRRMSRYKNVGGFYTSRFDAADNLSSRIKRQSTLKRSATVKSVSSMAIASRGPITNKEPEYSLWVLIKFIAGFNKSEWQLMLLGVFASILCGLANPVQAGKSCLLSPSPTLTFYKFSSPSRWLPSGPLRSLESTDGQYKTSRIFGLSCI